MVPGTSGYNKGESMRIRQFIKENRRGLDAEIKRQVPNVKLNDEKRRQWILNDENLYNWARREGVRI